MFKNTSAFLRRRLFSSTATMRSTVSLKRQAIDRVIPPTPMEIHLTDTESQLCDLLNECTDYLRTHNELSTSCRIAGGWVRDKLLGHDCNDIDIALSDVMGLAFAEHLASYAHEKGITTGTIAKIAQNPDQSKHLETATFKLFGLDIDLVNLRSEEYAEHSRIPTEVAFGTPLEDAKRRDITINALFYNVHTRSVEDYTEKGLDDMREGLIRTPLPPKETFQDDPLRVLRCIRFSSRYGFDLVPELKEAAKDAEIQNALISKVARERVGVEIDKILKGNNPLRGLEHIHCLSLYNPLFSAIPSDILSKFSGSPASPDLGISAAIVLNSLLSRLESPIPEPHPLFFKYLERDPSCRPRLFLAAFLVPYLSVNYVDKRNKTRPAIEVVIREALKLGTQSHYLDGIPILFTAVKKVQEFMDTYMTSTPEKERSSIGLFLRDKTIHNLSAGVHWSSSFFFSLLTEIASFYDVTNDSLDVEKTANVISKYNKFAEKVQALQLQDVEELKSLLDGREVIAAVGATQRGPWLSEALSRVMEWQLDHPRESKESCLTWLKEESNSGRLKVEDTSEPVSKRPRIK